MCKLRSQNLQTSKAKPANFEGSTLKLRMFFWFSQGQCDGDGDQCMVCVVLFDVTFVFVSNINNIPVDHICEKENVEV